MPSRLQARRRLLAIGVEDVRTNIVFSLSGRGRPKVKGGREDVLPAQNTRSQGRADTQRGCMFSWQHRLRFWLAGKAETERGGSTTDHDWYVKPKPANQTHSGSPWVILPVSGGPFEARVECRSGSGVYGMVHRTGRPRANSTEKVSQAFDLERLTLFQRRHVAWFPPNRRQEMTGVGGIPRMRGPSPRIQ